MYHILLTVEIRTKSTVFWIMTHIYLSNSVYEVRGQRGATSPIPRTTRSANGAPPTPATPPLHPTHHDAHLFALGQLFSAVCCGICSSARAVRVRRVGWISTVRFSMLERTSAGWVAHLGYQVLFQHQGVSKHGLITEGAHILSHVTGRSKEHMPDALN